MRSISSSPAGPRPGRGTCRAWSAAGSTRGTGTPGILRFKRGTHVGFVGRCTIEARGCPQELRRSLDALACIAPFSGTGAGATFGMDVTRYLRG